MTSINPKEIPDEKMRKAAELIEAIGEKLDLGIEFFIARQNGPQITSCMGICRFTPEVMDAFAATILKTDVIQEAMVRVEPLIQSKAITHKHESRVTNFFKAVRDYLES